MNVTTTSGERAVRRPLPKDMARILGDCRNLAIHRLLLTFTSMLDRVADLLMARAERSDVREEQTLCLDARSVLANEGARLIADFERHLRQLNPSLVTLYRARVAAYKDTVDDIARRSLDVEAGPPHVLGLRPPAGTPVVSQLERRSAILAAAATDAERLVEQVLA